MQEAMISGHYGDKIAGHISRDATAIHARGKTAKRSARGPASSWLTITSRPSHGWMQSDWPTRVASEYFLTYLLALHQALVCHNLSLRPYVAAEGSGDRQIQSQSRESASNFSSSSVLYSRTAAFHA